MYINVIFSQYMLCSENCEYVCENQNWKKRSQKPNGTQRIQSSHWTEEEETRKSRWNNNGWIFDCSGAWHRNVTLKCDFWAQFQRWNQFQVLKKPQYHFTELKQELDKSSCISYICHRKCPTKNCLNQTRWNIGFPSCLVLFSTLLWIRSPIYSFLLISYMSVTMNHSHKFCFLQRFVNITRMKVCV